jgi:DNA-directed RNA polymerase II subunit RPB1
MSRSTFTYDISDVKPITSIQFGVFGNDEIKKRSATKDDINGIEHPDLYDKLEPKNGGLLDSRMGGSNDNKCTTCGLSAKFCDGHEGHTELAKHNFHIGYLQSLKMITECVCIQCSNLLLPKNDSILPEIMNIKSKRKRFAFVHNIATKQKVCARNRQSCGIKTSSIKVEIKKKTGDIRVYAETINPDENEKGKHSQLLTPEVLSNILDRVSDDDLKIMGIYSDTFKPSDMIHRVFVVPAIHVRPSIRGFFTNGSTMEDSLTQQLGNIIKANIRVRSQIASNNENKNHAKTQVELLQYSIAYYYDSDAVNNQKADSKGVLQKPLVDRYKGKGGRIRGNLMGKRGDFNARTVITSDPVISINQLGVPVRVAMGLTFPETVTPYNKDKLTELVRNGPDKYPGANFVFTQRAIQSGGIIKPIYLKFAKEKINLQYGDVVERHLQDDDFVLLNRQPTLHKQSMMGHKIKVINNPDLLTFRLSVAVTPPYNADKLSSHRCRQQVDTQ